MQFGASDLTSGALVSHLEIKVLVSTSQAIRNVKCVNIRLHSSSKLYFPLPFLRMSGSEPIYM